MQGSPFLTPANETSESSLALISLGRDQIPAILRAPTAKEPNGQIINTKFGSFPHTTLLNLPWGSQVLASNVGAFNRSRGKKRKQMQAAEADNLSEVEEETIEFEAADSGFAHVLTPTPESWTTSLPHRTQVVYTPDYSFILHRICARPGTRLIEAGAGSGSFTHAAARAVFNGYPSQQITPEKTLDWGKVFSYEYHEPRYEILQKEIQIHGLDEIVQITHRDVYEEGFRLGDGSSPNADVVFLDLPCPWRALPHLIRSANKLGPSPLNPNAPIHLCSFSPCIEQAQKAVSTLRELGWVAVTMFALNHRRIEVRRDRVGLHEEGLRGTLFFPNSVDDAIIRLREQEIKATEFLGRRKQQMAVLRSQGKSSQFPDDEPGERNGPGSKQERLRIINLAAKKRKLYKEGRLTHKSEPELKTHTSYLVFATLPQEYNG